MRELRAIQARQAMLVLVQRAEMRAIPVMLGRMAIRAQREMLVLEQQMVIPVMQAIPVQQALLTQPEIVVRLGLLEMLAIQQRLQQ